MSERDEKQARHTPGPWSLKLGKYGAAHEVSWAPGRSYGLIARILTPGIQNLPEAKLAAEVEANARLIAAAPELLAALEFLTDASKHEPEMQIYRAHIEQARAAIRKAKGGENE